MIGESYVTCNEQGGPGRGSRMHDVRRCRWRSRRRVRRKRRRSKSLAVEGNQLVVRLPEGTRELTVADDFRFTINGQQLSVRDLRPGMKGTASITTRTTVTPVTVTEVKNGTVVRSVGSTIIVRTDEGVRSFTQQDVDKRGVKIIRSGKPAQVSDFREGDRLTATIITSRPPQVLTEKEVQATLASSRCSGCAGRQQHRSRRHRRPGRQRRPQPLPRRGPCQRPPARGRCSGSRRSSR